MLRLGAYRRLQVPDRLFGFPVLQVGGAQRLEVGRGVRHHAGGVRASADDSGRGLSTVPRHLAGDLCGGDVVVDRQGIINGASSPPSATDDPDVDPLRLLCSGFRRCVDHGG